MKKDKHVVCLFCGEVAKSCWDKHEFIGFDCPKCEARSKIRKLKSELKSEIAKLEEIALFNKKILDAEERIGEIKGEQQHLKKEKGNLNEFLKNNKLKTK